MILTASRRGRTLIVTDALIERFGLLTIIVLGETLTGVVTGLADEPLSALTPQRRAGRRRSRLRRLVDILRLRRTPPPQTEPRCERAMDAQPSAAHGSHSRDGRGDGQPHRSRPRRPHARSPPRGCCARAPPSCYARRCWYPQACKPGSTTGPSTSPLARSLRRRGRSVPRRRQRPGPRHSSSASCSSRCSASRGESPSRAA